VCCTQRRVGVEVVWGLRTTLDLLHAPQTSMDYSAWRQTAGSWHRLTAVLINTCDQASTYT
jgi:hypothetical protein